MTKLQKLEKEVLRLKGDMKQLGIDNCRMEMKLNAITEHFDVGYKVRMYERIRGEEKTDLVISPVVRDEPCKEKLIDIMIKKFKRTKWNKKK